MTEEKEKIGIIEVGAIAIKDFIAVTNEYANKTQLTISANQEKVLLAVR